MFKHILKLASAKRILPILNTLYATGGRMLASDIDLELSCDWPLPDGLYSPKAIETARAINAQPAKLDSFPLADFPLMPEQSVIHAIHFPADDAAKIAHAMADNDIRYYLNGMHFNLTDGRLESTDDHRCATVNILPSMDGTPEGYIVSRQAILLAIKLKMHTVEFSESQAVFTRDDGAMIRSKLIAGKFPDLEKVIPTGRVTTDLPGLASAIKSAAPVVKINKGESKNPTKLVFEGGTLAVYAPNKVASWPIGGNTPRIVFQAQYLLDVFANVNGPHVLQFGSATDSLRINCDIVTAVVMPIRF